MMLVFVVVSEARRVGPPSSTASAPLAQRGHCPLRQRKGRRRITTTRKGRARRGAAAARTDKRRICQEVGERRAPEDAEALSSREVSQVERVEQPDEHEVEDVVRADCVVVVVVVVVVGCFGTVQSCRDRSAAVVVVVVVVGGGLEVGSGFELGCALARARIAVCAPLKLNNANGCSGCRGDHASYLHPTAAPKAPAAARAPPRRRRACAPLPPRRRPWSPTAPWRREAGRSGRAMRAWVLSRRVGASTAPCSRRAANSARLTPWRAAAAAAPTAQRALRAAAPAAAARRPPLLAACIRAICLSTSTIDALVRELDAPTADERASSDRLQSSNR